MGQSNDEVIAKLNEAFREWLEEVNKHIKEAFPDLSTDTFSSYSYWELFSADMDPKDTAYAILRDNGFWGHDEDSLVRPDQ